MPDMDVGMTVGLIKALGSPDPAVIEGAVSDWLDDHPEATTTVEDGAINYAKLDSSLKGTVDDVGDLKTQIDNVKDLKEPVVLSGTYSGTRYLKIEKALAPGKYHITVENITSSDTDKTTCRFGLNTGNTENWSIQLDRGREIDFHIDLETECDSVWLYASTVYANSAGDTFTFTNLKIASEYELYTVVDGLRYYVTPEMFGAIGDGITDDTTAITQAFNTKKTVIFTKGKTYKMTGTIEFTRDSENSRNLLFANYGKIVYSGSSYPFILTGCDYFDVNLGWLAVDSGDGALLIRNGATTHTVYGNITFKILSVPSNKSCIVCDLNNSTKRYANDIKINGGKFTAGNSAIKFLKDSGEGGEYNDYRFFQCGFEGVSYVADLPELKTSMEFVECRLEESVTAFATYSNDFESAETVYSYVSWFGNSTLSFFSGLKNIFVRYYGKHTYGNYMTPGLLFYLNDIIYFNGVNNYTERAIQNRSIIDTIKGQARANLSRLLSTESVSSGSVNIVLNKEAFTPDIIISGDTEYLWNAREFPFNTFIVRCIAGSGGTINFVDPSENVLYTVSGAEKYIKIGYSNYGDVLYFEELNMQRVASVTL